MHCVRDKDTPRCGNCHWRGKTRSLSYEEGNSNTTRRQPRRLNAEAINAIFEEHDAFEEELTILKEHLDNRLRSV